MTTSRLELLHAEALRLDESDPAPKRDALNCSTIQRHPGVPHRNSLGPLPKQRPNWPPSLTTGAVWPWMPTLKATIRGTTPTSPLPTQALSTGWRSRSRSGLDERTDRQPSPAARQLWRSGEPTKILMDAPAFPSDTYALKSHLRQRDFDPDEHLIVVNSGTEEPTSPEALEAAIAPPGTRWHWA